MLSQRSTSVGLRYGLAVLSVAAALAGTQLLRAYFEPTPNSLFFCAIMLSSWFGGLGPGLLSGLLSVGIIDYYFIFPRYTLAINPEDVPRLAVFFVSAASISWLSDGRRNRSARRAINWN
jgi:K+-sensing histidine kinase KdpD